MRMIYPKYAPKWAQRLFPNFLWAFPAGNRKKLFLTFDDGPIPTVTPWVLEQLAAYDAKATFFCVGANIKKNPTIFEQIKKAGHSIGNHTFNHINGWETKDDIYFENIAQCQALTQTRLFRPPYAKIKSSQVKVLKSEYEIVMMDVLAGDFDPDMTGEKGLNIIKKYAKNGSIVLLHDSLKAWDRLEYILPRVLEYYTKLGFEFCAIDEGVSVETV